MTDVSVMIITNMTDVSVMIITNMTDVSVLIITHMTDVSVMMITNMTDVSVMIITHMTDVSVMIITNMTDVSPICQLRPMRAATPPSIANSILVITTSNNNQNDLSASCGPRTRRLRGRSPSTRRRRPERRSIFGKLSAHADGERRGLDRIGGVASERSRRDAPLRTFQIYFEHR